MFFYEYLICRLRPFEVDKYDPYDTIAINNYSQGMCRDIETAVNKAFEVLDRDYDYDIGKIDYRLVVIKHNDSPKHIFDKEHGLADMSDYDFINRLDEFCSKIEMYYDIRRELFTNVKYYLHAANFPVLVNTTPAYYNLYRHLKVGDRIKDITNGKIHEVLAKLHEEPLDPLQFFNYTPMIFIDDPNSKLIEIDKSDLNNANYQRTHKYIHSIQTNEMWRYKLV